MLYALSIFVVVERKKERVFIKIDRYDNNKRALFESMYCVCIPVT